MATIITGGSGLVGRALLGSVPQPVVLTRHPDGKDFGDGVQIRRWQPQAERVDPSPFTGARAVVHLAGESVAGGRWTDSRKRRIRDSRIEGTRNLVAALAAMDARPEVLVCASAVGIYGDRGALPLDETATPAADFLADVCVAWEREAHAAQALGIRVVCLRLGLVVAKEGGALQKMLPVFKLGLGGKLGSGEQWMPWVHVRDVVGLIQHALADSSLQGPVNVVAPQAVTNAEFTETLAQSLRRPAWLTVPAFALRLIFGEMAQVLLDSQRVVPGVAERSGYDFQYPTLSSALADAV